MKKIIVAAFAILCLIALSSCATGRYVVSYGNFAPAHDVEWDWEYDPPMFTVHLKSNIKYIEGADAENYEFAVIAAGGGVIPSEKIYDEGGIPDINTAGSYWRWISTVFVRLAEMPPDTDFPIKLQIIQYGKVIETFNVKLR
ncbi:MAG: hypothetical protein LBK66_07315 [Spirochaetaceae bacterium]|nr:hypothetical protein [Spirochaetaceae bacterium]